MSLVDQFDVVVVVVVRTFNHDFNKTKKSNRDSRREVLLPISKTVASDKCVYLILLASFKIINFVLNIQP